MSETWSLDESFASLDDLFPQQEEEKLSHNGKAALHFPGQKGGPLPLLERESPGERITTIAGHKVYLKGFLYRCPSLHLEGFRYLYAHPTALEFAVKKELGKREAAATAKRKAKQRAKDDAMLARLKAEGLL